MTQEVAINQTPVEAVGPIREYDIRGGGGITLRAREWGNPEGDSILFVHGWSQCDLCWSAQVSGPLATRFRMITFDNRGHGSSEKPRDTSCYADGQLWADDLTAVIEQTRLDRPVVVAWSYGGFIVADYVRAQGDGDIAGIDLVGAAVLLRPPSFDHLGQVFTESAPVACSSDLRTSIPAIQRLLRSCSARALDERLWSAALCWNMAVPPEVRAALITREIDNDDVLAGVSVPVLVTHGTADAIVLPSMAAYTLERCKTAVASWYEGIGHMPFVEDAERFNRELAAFVDRVSVR